MTQTNNEREALIAKKELLEDLIKRMNDVYSEYHKEIVSDELTDTLECINNLSPISQNEQQEAVEALRERDKLGYAVVGVIGKLDEIIDVAEDIEFNDFAHIAIPLELWNELKDALELMPERADNYTSPPKQIPYGWKPIETAPKGESVLVAGGDCNYPCVANWSGHHEDVWCVDGQMDSYAEIGWPTHWIPLDSLPELPTAPTLKEKG